jgi:hypothetical protein
MSRQNANIELQVVLSDNIGITEREPLNRGSHVTRQLATKR